MNLRSVATMMAVGCAVTMLTGCGVPQEEFDAKVVELNTAWNEIETLKGKITDLESLLSAEKTKVQNGVMALDSATERIKATEKKEAQTAVALADEKAKVVQLEAAVTSAKSATTRANEAAMAVQGELEALQAEYTKLNDRFEQFKKNMSALTSPPKSSAPAASSSAVIDASPLDILNDMGSK